MERASTLPPDERTEEHGRVAHELPVQRFLQPDDVTCGPTCLRKVYDFYGLQAELGEVIGEIDRNEDGGTLAVFLGIAALRRGFAARIFAYDQRVFDPTWVPLPMDALADKVRRRLPHLQRAKTIRAAQAYLRFLEEGGEVGWEELLPALLKRILNRDHPVLAGLSATHLYRMMREWQDPHTGRLREDDVRGDPIGHFVVISGYRRWGREFVVLDPSAVVPGSADGRLIVDAQRLINSILLGDLTYDAVLLELWPAGETGEGERNGG